ncbi:helix-turn-helix domain-containing protein [Microbacterium sp. PAMC21962]|uniref:helix-turn-helix domain-containing protein n=1 Tax=Microbacterium sp. PAMC21962 TaxID=2861280 RepID=UPI001C62782F|nr:helix-turn-helix domain-containing protein [Microbacterium sp. PAMC21962]QYF98482.1 helix-turn-helix domain-containing protein [Microbacterium sp. PAMC21962]
MSVKVSSWVWHGDECATLTGNELILMLALADVAGDEGRCRYLDDESDMTYGALAKKVRVDKRTIIRLVAKLRAAGLLEQKRGQNGRPNEFTVVVPWASRRTGDNLSPVPEAEPVTPVRQPVTPETRTGDKVPIDSSYRRIDVEDVYTSDVASDDLPKYSSEIIRLCDLLASHVRANGHKVGVVGETWHAACDRLIRLDGYTVEQVEWMIRWATADEFWAANIRSMPTLREKFSTLVLQAKRKAQQSPTHRASSVIDMGRRLQQQADAQRRGIAS